MIISDIDYVEDVPLLSEVEGGGRWSRNTDNGYGTGNSWFSMIQPILQSLNIFPAASSTVANLGGTSIGNTAISTNISMPIFIVINQFGSGREGNHNWVSFW